MNNTKEKIKHKVQKLDAPHRKKLIAWAVGILIFSALYVGLTSLSLYNDKKAEDDYWEYYLHESENFTKEEKEISKDAVKVQTGTYIENFKSLDMKNSQYEVVLQVWFRWEGNRDVNMADNFRIVNGTINSADIIKDYYNDDINYQLLRIDVTVAKSFWTKRFPLSSHQLRMYVEATKDIDEVLLVPDEKNSGISNNIKIAGFNVSKHAVNTFIQHYKNTNLDPEYDNVKPHITSEILTAIELNRDSWGLYLKCIIALLGTNIWVLIPLFICTNHKVNTLALIPPVFFGTVTNIMVGANLLPDAMEAGLIEYVNIWGILVVLLVAVTVVKIEFIRDKHENYEYSNCFGRVMLGVIIFVMIIGYILLPISAYKFN